MYCKMLMSTLSGTVLEWFVSLCDGHVTTFDQFATLSDFLMMFFMSNNTGGVCEGLPEQVRRPSGEAETH